MKVIFLDIDGVLAIRSSLRKGCWQLDPGGVGRLNRLVRETQAKIVVSSTWRIGRTLDQLKEVLAEQGVKIEPIIGVTPRTQMNGCRGDDIQRWLTDNPGVEVFVILDDDADMLHLLPSLVKTDMVSGLTDHHVSLAKRKLVWDE